MYVIFTHWIVKSAIALRKNYAKSWHNSQAGPDFEWIWMVEVQLSNFYLCCACAEHIFALFIILWIGLYMQCVQLRNLHKIMSAVLFSLILFLFVWILFCRCFVVEKQFFLLTRLLLRHRVYIFTLWSTKIHANPRNWWIDNAVDFVISPASETCQIFFWIFHNLNSAELLG